MKKIPVITVIGSVNIDLITKTERLPLPGETLFGKNFLISFGGKGANQAIAASRLGGKVNFLFCVGNDFFGKIVIENLKKENIEIMPVISSSGISTGIAIIIVDNKGENSIIVNSGANYELNRKDIENKKNSIFKSDIIVLQLEIPLILFIMQ